MFLPITYIILFLAFTCFAFYPGSPGLDAKEDLLHLSLNIINGLRPPLYKLLAQALAWVDPDHLEAGLFLFQTAVYSLSVLIFSIRLLRRWYQRIALLMITTLSPPILANISYIGTDMLFVSILMVLAVLFLFRPDQNTITLSLLGLTLSFCATLTRYNGIIAILPFIAYYFQQFIFGNRRKTISLCLSWICAFVTCTVIFLECTKITELIMNDTQYKSSLQYTSQYNHQLDLTGTSLHAAENLLTQKYSAWTLQDLAEIYSPNAGTLFWKVHSVPMVLHPYSLTSDAQKEYFIRGKKLSFTSSEEEYNELRQQWLSAVLKHPIAYLTHRWQMFASLLGIAGHPHCLPYEDTISYELAENAKYRIQPDTLRYTLNRKLFLLFYTLKESVFFSGWIYLAIHLLFFLLFSFSSRNIPVSLKLINQSALLYLSAYFFIGPACFFRYILWPAFAAHILIGIALLTLRTDERVTPKD